MIIEYRLQFISPLIGALDSDTLMGALAWAMVRTKGVKALTAWIERCCEGHPPFVVSNGFPSGYFPKPMLLPLRHERLETKQEQLQLAKENKRLKGRKWITADEFLQVLQGQPLSNDVSSEPVAYSDTQVHAVIDRTTGKSLSEHGLYEVSFSGYSHVSVFVQLLDPDWDMQVTNLLKFLELDGLGARKSTGHGQFRILSKQVLELPEVKNRNGHVILSNFVPAVNDPHEGRYRIKTKYGKVAEEFSQSGVPFKKPLLMIESGACFYSSEAHPYFGRLITGIAPQRPEVVQFCYGLAIPAHLPV